MRASCSLAALFLVTPFIIRISLFLHPVSCLFFQAAIVDWSDRIPKALNSFRGAVETTQYIGEIREMLAHIMEPNKYLIKRMDPTTNYMDNMLQALEQLCCSDVTDVEIKEESSWQRRNSSADGVTQDMTSTGTLTLHLPQINRHVARKQAAMGTLPKI